ncbi:hypothetical protein A3A76_01875 [Candidatus Woesebacteria bacterium RIFCSPLOWO2_01_FULL_39_23]|uniref:Uncharacterized protein n=1 Tax=Candidatus Woesebacteria bacterium RIFCSPHIGHO2_01_FULL_40_22 TaxID=1802499 RepID=A0A1F7YIJ4_9BACT|nr:MAG: hypothetical protein A2141_05275 [Candidatus Woesebacteria bacterium RBG_16_40_11]OGM26345.1 MAG: hypothetical protein A2628_03220 [Candidatus Woesebacteria bacterium RIFCSPHIGHO2_01_FULL_40_22]OGM37595.1 MAG: hypothetical protein A3E41_05195 [Candidatus Woesebacteria bacterium RIFCSPHIGHO2_12_FULL_38_9]OGM61888.1 MAG: hypothetical protein A3A76_01875 [Candidatus Woesebacteria bacterium RIFCSPLOWO2_01_FULL_39_23]
MELPSNVRIKKGLWNIFPFSKYTAQAIYPNIYFTKDVFEDLKSNSPNPRYIAALKHEQTHIERQKKVGWVNWGLRYIFSPNFRFNEELEAIKSSIKYLKNVKGNFDTARSAKFLSSWLYLWCISYDKAKEQLDGCWIEV